MILEGSSQDPWSAMDKIEFVFGSDGNCYKRRKSKNLPLPGARECSVVDIILNYFIARTETAGSVRMDPRFENIAHREWFIDAIGRLR